MYGFPFPLLLGRRAQAEERAGALLSPAPLTPSFGGSPEARAVRRPRMVHEGGASDDLAGAQHQQERPPVLSTHALAPKLSLSSIWPDLAFLPNMQVIQTHSATPLAWLGQELTGQRGVRQHKIDPVLGK